MENLLKKLQAAEKEYVETDEKVNDDGNCVDTDSDNDDDDDIALYDTSFKRIGSITNDYNVKDSCSQIDKLLDFLQVSLEIREHVKLSGE